jgi:hypothetical protein
MAMRVNQSCPTICTTACRHFSGWPQRCWRQQSVEMRSEKPIFNRQTPRRCAPTWHCAYPLACLPACLPAYLPAPTPLFCSTVHPLGGSQTEPSWRIWHAHTKSNLRQEAQQTDAHTPLVRGARSYARLVHLLEPLACSTMAKLDITAIVNVPAHLAAQLMHEVRTLSHCSRRRRQRHSQRQCAPPSPTPPPPRSPLITSDVRVHRRRASRCYDACKSGRI